MLYITTRTNKDAFTAHKALHSNVAADGGMYVPFRFPEYSSTDISRLREKSFNQVLADVLNLFFSCRLTGWDVDFCIGRNCLRLADTGNKVIIAELWHNLSSSYAHIVKRLYEQIAKSHEEPSDWFYIALEIATLFGTYSELLKSNQLTATQCVDVSIPVDDFRPAISAWYARKMGLPIGKIICSGNEDGVIWDFLHRGTFNTSLASTETRNTVTRLIQGALGYDAVEEFLEKCEKSQVYTVSEDMLPYLNQGFFCCVVGEGRADSIINSVYRNNTYIIDPTSALCYGGLQDYRAKTGCNHITALLSRESALCHATQVAQATGLTKNQLTELLNHF